LVNRNGEPRFRIGKKVWIPPLFEDAEPVLFILLLFFNVTKKDYLGRKK